MQKRHIFFYKLLRPLAPIFLWIKFGYRYQKATNLPDTYIVLSNHTTDYDFLMVTSSFPQQMYFVGSEHIARWKFLYKILCYCFGFITRSKGTTASSTVMEMLRTLRSGSNVCLFAEGNRCWDGITGAILPSTGKVVKKARCGLVTYRIEGGYFASPRWSGANTRRGRVYGAPVNVYTAEQLATMSADEINAIITRDLHEDAYARQLASPSKYKGKGLAENMETVLFICPQCGKLDTFQSHDDTVSCSACGLSFCYNEYGMLEGAPFRTVRELYTWQLQQVENAIDNGMAYTADSGKLSLIADHSETMISQGPVTMDGNSLTCGDVTIPVEQIIHLAIHGRHGLVFSTADTYYELLPDKKSNALKFCLLYEACKHRISNG